MILQNLIDAIHPLRVYLFGSYGAGMATEESDYDFYLVVPGDAPREIEISQAAYKAIFGVSTKPVDILIGKRTEFQKRMRFLYSYTPLILFLRKLLPINLFLWYTIGMDHI